MKNIDINSKIIEDKKIIVTKDNYKKLCYGQTFIGTPPYGTFAFHDTDGIHVAVILCGNCYRFYDIDGFGLSYPEECKSMKSLIKTFMKKFPENKIYYFQNTGIFLEWAMDCYKEIESR